MAHFAKIKNGTVVEVVVIGNEQASTETKGKVYAWFEPNQQWIELV